MPRLIGNEAKYVQEVLSHEFCASKAGFMVARLEHEFPSRFGIAHGVAMCNGTATLHAILAAEGIGPGDEVIVPALTMASTSLAVLHAGATPVWADVRLDSWCMDPDSAEGLISERTRAIIAVALYGIPPDLDKLVQICRSRNLVLIEDNAQCVLGTYGRRLAGTFGKASSFSFQSSKTLTAGEGGIVITNDEALSERIRSFACLGYHSNIRRGDIQHPDAERHYSLGWNYRMSDLQAAVCLAQLEDVEYHVNTRKNAAHAMSQDCEWLIPQSAGYDYQHAAWSLAYRLEDAPVTWERFRETFLSLGGDPFYACWLPNYMEPALKYKGEWPEYNSQVCPVAERIQPNIIALKTNYDLLDEALEQGRILERTIEECEKKDQPAPEEDKRSELIRRYNEMGI